ncbi:SusD/RagB family nutrient-binding outer membrane lipoprotein [Sphingobacterium sp. Lzh-3]|uniref:SusD/RagB family nutrient-binding outer membrane lipoprotein n=1 Tax=Sphingobacterium sp. Lzh-3 TaxID=3382150 RepID=UPI00398D3383
MKKIILPLLAISIGVSSCKKFLDINDSPNSPKEENISNSLIVPGIEMNLAASYGNYFRIIGGYYAEHYSQTFGTSNYLDYSQFFASQTRSAGTYTQLNTRVLKNANTVIEKAKASSDWSTYLIAKTLRVFAIQSLVDAYGETPYSEALKDDILSPKYDDGKDVYTGILAELNEALSKVEADGPIMATFLYPKVGGQDPTTTDWIRFANALKLKLLMRMSKVQDVKNELANLVNANMFPLKDVAYANMWVNETGKANPFYQEEFASYFGSTQENVILNLALSATLEDDSDARLSVFFDKNSSGLYKGGVSGTNFSISNVYTASYFNRPKMSYDSPVYLITKAEIEFFLAEYYAKYGSSGQAKSHYETAITQSFLSAGLTQADAAKVFQGKYAYDNAKYEKLIGIQKWIALSGTNNFEAWCELRRLKYPTFGTITGANIYNESNDTFKPELYVPGTLYTPIKYNTELGPNKVLQRIRYAQSSTNSNSNAPAVRPDGEPVFWAK